LTVGDRGDRLSDNPMLLKSALRLLPRLGDTGYPGLHQLGDGTIVATTYGVLTAGEKPSIVSLQFTMSEVDVLAAKTTSGAKP
jgi:hypothetical protein